MPILPPRQRFRQRLITMKIHLASAVLVFALNERASRLMLDFRTAILAPATLGRLIKMIRDTFPVRHD